MTTDTTSNRSDPQAAGEKFLALNSGNLAAYLEGCVKCGQCATACHFYEVTGDPKYKRAAMDAIRYNFDHFQDSGGLLAMGHHRFIDLAKDDWGGDTGKGNAHELKLNFLGPGGHPEPHKNSRRDNLEQKFRPRVAPPQVVPDTYHDKKKTCNKQKTEVSVLLVSDYKTLAWPTDPDRVARPEEQEHETGEKSDEDSDSTDRNDRGSVDLAIVGVVDPAHF